MQKHLQKEITLTAQHSNLCPKCGCLGARDVLGRAGRASTNARHAEERGRRQLARMFAHTNWTFLVGFFTKLGLQARRNYEKMKRQRGSIDQRTCCWDAVK
jgi:hypothetical protein